MNRRATWLIEGHAMVVRTSISNPRLVWRDVRAPRAQPRRGIAWARQRRGWQPPPALSVPVPSPHRCAAQNIGVKHPGNNICVAGAFNERGGKDGDRFRTVLSSVAGCADGSGMRYILRAVACWGPDNRVSLGRRERTVAPVQARLARDYPREIWHGRGFPTRGLTLLEEAVREGRGREGGARCFVHRVSLSRFARATIS